MYDIFNWPFKYNVILFTYQQLILNMKRTAENKIEIQCSFVCIRPTIELKHF